MARLPDYRAQRGLNPGSAPLVSVDRSGLAQVAQFGGAVSAAGDQVLAFQEQQQKRERQKEDFTAAQEYQRMQIALGADQDLFLEQAPADGSGFTQKFIGESFQKRRDEFLAKVPERSREKYMQVLETDLDKWSTNAARIERDRLYEHSQTVIGEQQNSFLNSISLDAGAYEQSLASGLAIIDAAPIPEGMKAVARRNWEANALTALAQKLIADDPVNAKKALGGGSEAQGPASKQAAALLREFEGFRNGTYWDVNAHRTGYGSDTITRADGSVQKVRKGDKVSRTDAERDLARRTKEFESTAIKQVGGKEWGALPDKARAALISVTYNYGSLPDRVVIAAKTGDVEAVASAVEGLKTDNEGINSGRRQKEANIIRGASGIQGEGEIAPVFSGMDFETRMKALNLADKTIAGQQSEIISALAEQKGAIQLQIATNDPNLTVQGILDTSLKDSDKASLIKSLNSAREDERSIADYASRIDGGAPFDPFDTADRKGVDSVYDKIAGGGDLLNDRRAQEFAQYVFGKTGILPKSALNQLRRGVGSTDPQQVAAAASIAGNLAKADTEKLLGARDGGSAIEKSANTFRDLTENLGYTAEQAGQQMAEANDPQKIREREALLETDAAKEYLKKVTPKTLTSAMDGWLSFEPEFATEQSAAVAVLEYKEFWQRAMVENGGNEKMAEKNAMQKLRNIYGPSEFVAKSMDRDGNVGDNIIVRYPVELTYPAIEGSHDWVADQAREDLEASGIDAFPALKVLGIEVAEKSPIDVIIQPSPETEADIDAGRAPKYQLYYKGADGIIQQYPGYFEPDYRSAREKWRADKARENQDAAIDMQDRKPVIENARKSQRRVLEKLGTGTLDMDGMR